MSGFNADRTLPAGDRDDTPVLVPAPVAPDLLVSPPAEPTLPLGAGETAERPVTASRPLGRPLLPGVRLEIAEIGRHIDAIDTTYAELLSAADERRRNVVISALQRIEASARHARKVLER